VNPLSNLQADWPAINRLLDEALALPPAERGAWLAALPAEMAELKDTLARLLASTGGIETGDFLHTLPKLDTAAPGETAAAAQAGSEVGPWRLLRELGEGGMGSVWLAERADGSLKRQVAVKLPRVTWQRGLAERMARERDILATLEHPNIARLYDAGVDMHGRPWLALEYVQGRPIDEHARDKALDMKQRVQLLLQVCEAVAFAHSRLVIHRDLKPGNILVTDDGQVKLLDFGIAKLMQGENAAATALTELSGRALTLDYASPEQVRGQPLTTASDVYSLGVVAYELLSGTRPYKLKRGSAAELEEAIESAEVPAASAAVMDKAMRQALKGDLDAILGQALQKEAARRYQSVDALAGDLARHLAGEPVAARPDNPLLRARRLLRRHPLPLSVAGIIALALLGGAHAQAAVMVALGAGALLAAWQRREALQQAELARAEAGRASDEVARQEAVRNLYIEAITRLAVMGKDEPAALARPGAVNAVVRDQLERHSQRLQAVPGALQAQLEAVALQLNYSNDFEGALAVGQQYLAHLQQHASHPALVINAYAMLGRTLFQLRRVDESENFRRAGLAWAPEANDERTVSSRLVLSLDLGRLLVTRGRRTEAEAVLLSADALAAERLPGTIQRAETLHSLGAFHQGFDDVRALDCARQAHSTVRGLASASDNFRESDLLWLGGALVGAGLPDQAVPVLREALALTTRLFGLSDRNTVRSTGRLSGALARTGQHGEVRVLLQEALARQPPHSPGDSAWLNVVQLQAREVENEWLFGDVDAAVARISPDPSAFLGPLSFRGGDQLMGVEVRALVLAGRAVEALALAARLHLEWADRGLPTAPWLRIESTLGLAQLAAGETAAAQVTATRLLALLDAGQARSTWTWRTAHEIAALAAAGNGDLDAAQDRLAAALTALASAPSRVERAESALRVAETLAILERGDESRRAAQQALSDLAVQHPASPRLLQARRLAGA
jgi:hypothetical protein